MTAFHTHFLWEVFSNPGAHEYPVELAGSKAGIQAALKEFAIVDSIHREEVKRPLAAVSIAGSHNYDCAGKDSDQDYKIVYIPSWEDFYYGKTFPKMDVITDALDLSLHPIHQFRHHMLKGNMNFFEILYSRSIVVNPDLKEFWRAMRQLVAMNVSGTVLASYMQARSRFKRTTEPTEETEYMFKIAGYNYKAASFSIRMLSFILTLLGDGNISIVPVKEYRDFIMELKAGTVPHSTFEVAYKFANEAVTGSAFKHYNSHRDWEFSKRVQDLDRSGTDDYRDLNRHADDELKGVILDSLMIR